MCILGTLCRDAAVKDKLSGHCELSAQQEATITNTKMAATILTTESRVAKLYI